MKTDKEIALQLIEQLIAISKDEDINNKKNNISNNASKTIGDSFYVFHLKQLKEIVDKIQETV